MSLEIGLTEFTLDVPIMPAKALEAYSSRVFDRWESRLAADVPLPDYSLHLEIVEGSLKGKGRIWVATAKFVAAVSVSGGLISAVKEISWAVRSGGTYLAQVAAEPYADVEPHLRVKRSTAKLGEIERLITRVQSGQLERGEAAILAQALFEEDEPGAAELATIVCNTIGTVQRTPTQLVLPLEEFETLMISKPETPSPPPRRPKPKSEVPLPERFRAEVWRESKKGRKHITVSPL